jgi:hypothetical protein
MGSNITDLLDSMPEGWRPQPGDKLIAVVIGSETRTTEYGEYPILTVRTDSGQDVAVHAFHTVLRRELEKLQPRVGDRIGIAYHGLHPTRGYERYRVVITRDTGGSDSAVSEPSGEGPSGSDDDDGIPF